MALPNTNPRFGKPPRWPKGLNRYNELVWPPRSKKMPPRLPIEGILPYKNSLAGRMNVDALQSYLNSPPRNTRPRTSQGLSRGSYNNFVNVPIEYNVSQEYDAFPIRPSTSQGVGPPLYNIDYNFNTAGDGGPSSNQSYKNLIASDAIEANEGEYQYNSDEYDDEYEIKLVPNDNVVDEGGSTQDGLGYNEPRIPITVPPHLREKLRMILLRMQTKISSRTRRPWFDLVRTLKLYDRSDEGICEEACFVKALEHFHILMSDEELLLVRAAYPDDSGTGFYWRAFANSLYPESGPGPFAKLRDGRFAGSQEVEGIDDLNELLTYATPKPNIALLQYYQRFDPSRVDQSGYSVQKGFNKRPYRGSVDGGHYENSNRAPEPLWPNPATPYAYPEPGVKYEKIIQSAPKATVFRPSTSRSKESAGSVIPQSQSSRPSTSGSGRRSVRGSYNFRRYTERPSSRSFSRQGRRTASKLTPQTVGSWKTTYWEPDWNYRAQPAGRGAKQRLPDLDSLPLMDYKRRDDSW